MATRDFSINVLALVGLNEYILNSYILLEPCKAVAVVEKPLVNADLSILENICNVITLFIDGINICLTNLRYLSVTSRLIYCIYMCRDRSLLLQDSTENLVDTPVQLLLKSSKR